MERFYLFLFRPWWRHPVFLFFVFSLITIIILYCGYNKGKELLCRRRVWIVHFQYICYLLRYIKKLSKENSALQNQLFYAENLIVVQIFRFYIKKNRIQKLRFSDGILDPGWFRKVREACRNHFHLFSSKTLRRIPSYDQKTYNFHDY